MKGVRGERVVEETDKTRTKNGRMAEAKWGGECRRIRPSYIGGRTDECINNAIKHQFNSSYTYKGRMSENYLSIWNMRGSLWSAYDRVK